MRKHLNKQRPRAISIHARTNLIPLLLFSYGFEINFQILFVNIISVVYSGAIYWDKKIIVFFIALVLLVLPWVNSLGRKFLGGALFEHKLAIKAACFR